MTEAEAGLLAPPSGDPTSSLIHLLDLGELEGARTDEDIFLGPSQQQPRQRVFGGQVLAQSLIAAMRTVDPDRLVHSMHGYFLRPGDANKPITFGVQRLRDGRSFSARRVHAYQEGVPILSMIASFQDADEGLDHQSDDARGHPGSRVAAQHRRPAGQVRPSRGPALGLRAALRHPPRGPAPLCLGQGQAGSPERGLDEDLRPHAGRPQPAPGGPGLRQRLHAAGVHPAPPRPELDHARHERGQPGPRHVVAPARPRGRVAALRPGIPQRPGRARAWPRARSSTRPGSTWPPWRRRAWSACPPT